MINIENVEFDNDVQEHKDLLENDGIDENLKYEEKHYFDNIEKIVDFNVVSKYHKK